MFEETRFVRGERRSEKKYIVSAPSRERHDIHYNHNSMQGHNSQMLVLIREREGATNLCFSPLLSLRTNSPNAHENKHEREKKRCIVTLSNSLSNFSFKLPPDTVHLGLAVTLPHKLEHQPRGRRLPGMARQHGFQSVDMFV